MCSSNAPFPFFFYPLNMTLLIFPDKIYKTFDICLFVPPPPLQILAHVPSLRSHLRSPKCCLAWRNRRSFQWWTKPMPRQLRGILDAPRRLSRNGAGSCLNVASRTSQSKVNSPKFPEQGNFSLRPKARKKNPHENCDGLT